MLDKVESFQTFNQFFYRKLRPGARHVASPDPNVAVSPADCRMLAFATVDEATRYARPPSQRASSDLAHPADCARRTRAGRESSARLWIKGREFSLEGLLRDEQLANYFRGGSLAIFRCASPKVQMRWKRVAFPPD